MIFFLFLSDSYVGMVAVLDAMRRSVRVLLATLVSSWFYYFTEKQ